MTLKSLVIDMDETLIGNDCIGDFPSMLVDGSAITPRPNAEIFLEKARNEFETLVLCSFSTIGRVSSLLMVLGWGKWFDMTLGREDVLAGLPRDIGEFLMVDDWHWNSNLIFGKLKLFGKNPEDMTPAAIKDIIVRVEPFFGQPEDVELLRVWDEIMRRKSSVAG